MNIFRDLCKVLDIGKHPLGKDLKEQHTDRQIKQKK